MIRFRPYPGFTIFTLIMVTLLCGLGVWQVQRLHWKLDLIAKIERGLSAQPVSIGEAYGDAADMDAASHMAAADYRRVSLRGHFLNNQEMRFFATDANGDPVYHVITPFAVPGLWDFMRGAAVIGKDHRVHGGGTTGVNGVIFVDRGVIPLALANPAQRRQGLIEGDTVLSGVLRNPDAPSWFTPAIDAAHRVVYTRDPKTLAAFLGYSKQDPRKLAASLGLTGAVQLFPMFIEAGATPSPGGWPKGGQTVVDLPNNHLSYAITWFGLAAGLLGVYVAYHVSKGRLGRP